MEAEEQAYEAQYLEAFNNGYLIAQHEPELSNKLAANNNDQSVYFKALVEGKKQYDAETKEWLKSFRKGKSTAPNNDLSKGKDDKKFRR